MLAAGGNGPSQVGPSRTMPPKSARPAPRMRRSVSCERVRSPVTGRMANGLSIPEGRRIDPSGFGQVQASAGRVVVEDLGVATPVDGRVELGLGLLLAEVLVEDVEEEIVGQGAVGLGAQRVADLAQQRHVLQRRFAE